MRTVFTYEKLIEVGSRGFDAGATMRSATTMEWNIAGKCERPVFRTLSARPVPSRWSGIQRLVRPESKVQADGRRDIEFWTRCRKCGPCLRMRSAMWRFRAQNEVKAAPRTWFVTLTLNPGSHFEMQLRAITRLRERGSDWDSMTADQQFAERHHEVSIELTKWIKRVRKASGAPLRYCLVAEAHKSGLPHYHALIHEVDVNRPVRASTLRSKWGFGFSQCKLVAEGEENKSAAYVAKYLAKSAISRVRASLGYGHPLPFETLSKHSLSHKKDVTLPDPPSKRDKEIDAERRKAFARFTSEQQCSEPSNFRPWASLCPTVRVPRRAAPPKGYQRLWGNNE